MVATGTDSFFRSPAPSDRVRIVFTLLGEEAKVCLPGEAELAWIRHWKQRSAKLRGRQKYQGINDLS